jgi:hypothetical protein
MEADYSIELGPEAPALELPWEDPEGRWNYLELRGAATAAEPDWQRNLQCRIDCIPEARPLPALRHFLLAANSPLSAWKTAKCSVWPDAADAAENDFNAGFTLNSYIDLALADEYAGLRDDLHTHERLAAALAESLAENRTVHAIAEVVVRRCYFHDESSEDDSQAGYSLTLFLIGYGNSAVEATDSLAAALTLAVESLAKVKAR